MATSAHRNAVLALYRQLLRESNRFDAFIYRKYAVRRVRDAFRQNKTLDDTNRIEQLMAEGRTTLDMIRRQVVINQLYKSDKLVVEGSDLCHRYKL